MEVLTIGATVVAGGKGWLRGFLRMLNPWKSKQPGSDPTIPRPAQPLKIPKWIRDALNDKDAVIELSRQPRRYQDRAFRWFDKNLKKVGPEQMKSYILNEPSWVIAQI
ncbi:MAG TPA: hypothetical protein DF383_03245, partial [Deltaproteobacteria bacterium]|nr:hypothetical protein [Deltaproteobacteria bacterium]